MGIGIGTGLSTNTTTVTDWIPTNVAGCQLWLRADLGITIGTGVSQWNDQSGNSNNVSQGTGVSQPTLSSNGAPNGWPCLTFSSQFLSTSTIVIAASPWSVFIISKTNNAATEAFSFAVGQSINGMAFGLDGVTSHRALWYPGAAILQDNTGASTTNWEGLTAQNNGTTSTLKINGTLQTITNSTTQPVTPTGSTTVGGRTW